MNIFATRLKILLDERGITQKWLADAANTKEATISRYITGVNKSPRPIILGNIAKALNVTTDYLLGLTDVPQVKTDISSEERILLSAFRKATDRDVSVIWHLLDPYITPSERGSLQILKQNEDDAKIG